MNTVPGGSLGMGADFMKVYPIQGEVMWLRRPQRDTDWWEILTIDKAGIIRMYAKTTTTGFKSLIQGLNRLDAEGWGTSIRIVFE